MSQQHGVIFSFQDIHVTVEEKEVVKGVSMTIQAGEKHALMGPNGSGKSSLANALMGHPAYRITKGTVTLDGRDITALEPDEKARLGLFLCLQYPVAVPGVTVANFLRSAVKARTGQDSDEVKNFRKNLKATFGMLEVDPVFAMRYLNEGFSGGEKKRLEILQMAMLRPRVALLDETDSGLDIDALKIVAKGINTVCDDEVGLLLVTHYQRLLNYVEPTHVHVLVDGRIARSGGPGLAHELEEKGYEWLEKKVTA